MIELHGHVDEGFGRVADAFAANFDDHGEVGAAFALYVGGRRAVDVWAGTADPATGAPWQEDTLQLVFSTTKGATAVCALLLAQSGKLDLDAPVAEYWPEFAAEEKHDIPVRWLLSHRAGLPTVDGTLTRDDLLAWEPVVNALAAQKPYWEPGTTHGYHALTYGWLVGEVVRRVSGRSLGTFFVDEVAAPLGLDFCVGLPVGHRDRVSRLVNPAPAEPGALESVPEAARKMAEAFLDPSSLSYRALHMTHPPMDWNDHDVHAAEIPAANGIGTARSLARMYAATIGDVDGVRLLDGDTVAAASTEQSNGADRVLFVPTRIGLGFFLHSQFKTMTGPRAFGHGGAGGSLAFADPDAGIGFGYVMNQMQSNLAGDPRTLTLIDAVNASL